MSGMRARTRRQGTAKGLPGLPCRRFQIYQFNGLGVARVKKIVFYEKPGCKGNARQKAMLESAGYALETRSILDEPWQADVLRAFFGDRPVADWFNWKAPAVKRGEVEPDSFNAAGALEIMLREPILIRRPLIDLNGQKACGFDESVLAMLGVGESSEGMEACQNSKERCD